jgi:hypothetical protein
MAKRHLEILVDDLDGNEADETVQFGLDGENYEIDLTAANAEALRELLAPYLEGARRAAPKRGRRKAAKPATGAATPSALIRAWAAENGLTVNTRGRIPADVVAAYEAAHA